MSYAATTDFIGLLRLTAAGTRAERMPGLDYLVSAFARAGLFELSIGQAAPVPNQTTPAWFKPAAQSWASEGTLFLWNADAGDYEFATPMLWAELLVSSSRAANVQEITNPGPANINGTADVVLVNQTVSAPITLVLPLASAKIGDVLVSDWKGDSGAGNTITINTTAPDVFPGGGVSWQIAGNGASVLFKPIAGRGYAL